MADAGAHQVTSSVTGMYAWPAYACKHKHMYAFVQYVGSECIRTYAPRTHTHTYIHVAKYIHVYVHTHDNKYTIEASWITTHAHIQTHVLA